MKKGISLITLVITIIVMIIIAGVIVISLNSSGIFDKATKAVFVSDIKTLLEEYNIYAAFYIAEGNNIRELNVPVSDIKSIVKAVPDGSIYAEKIAVVNGYLTYMVNLRDRADVERANWACEAGMKVNGFTGCSDIEFVETHIPAFEKRGKIYYNTPDLTGLNPDMTYFVTYDENGNEILGNKISKKPPEDWFDYENKEWANIVVINETLGTRVYYTWIPRYAYKVVKDETNPKVDVRFVDNNNVYIAEDGTKIAYNDTEPTFDNDEDQNQTNYVVSSAFNINIGTEESPEMRALSGFWMMKYEAQESVNITQSIGTDFIDIMSVDNGGGGTYDYYIDGKLDGENKGASYKYQGLEHDRKYTVKIVAKDVNENPVSTYIREYTTLGENTHGITMFPADTYGDKIVVYSTTLTDLAAQNNVKTFEYYLDDVLIDTNSTGVYTYEGLTNQTTYKVTIKLKDSGIYYGEYTRTLTTTGVPTYGEANAPELGALLKAGTYYLTWDADGNEIRTSVVDDDGNPVAAPSNWYNYQNKEWANIVITNETLGSEVYYTWIPRYEYKVMGVESGEQADKKVDISFIPATKLEPTVGYLIPASFDINMGTEENPDIRHLSGFWMMKYEAQDVPEVTE